MKHKITLNIGSSVNGRRNILLPATVHLRVAGWMAGAGSAKPVEKPKSADMVTVTMTRSTARVCAWLLWSELAGDNTGNVRFRPFLDALGLKHVDDAAVEAHKHGEYYVRGERSAYPCVATKEWAAKQRQGLYKSQIGLDG